RSPVGSLPHDGRRGDLFNPFGEHGFCLLRTGVPGECRDEPAGTGIQRLLSLMSVEPIKVLVLCTGNSCRSIMAEALINHMGQGRYRAWSAGSHPAGYVHPGSVSTLKRHGIDPGQPYSKSWDDMISQPFDL